MKYYDKKNKRLLCMSSKATHEFWDEHWGNFELSDIINDHPEYNLCVKVSKNYLPEGALILEGGCGNGKNVQALHAAGYRCTGVDYAEKTVARIKELIPELDVRLDDLFDLKIESKSYDGFWSIGVIEHFTQGYDILADEMVRVLKKDGYLFLVVPAMSPLRRLKASLGCYKELTADVSMENFYCYFLDPQSMIGHFEGKGFVLKKKFYINSFKAVKNDTWHFMFKIMQKVYNSRGRCSRMIRKSFEKLFDNMAGHCVCLVFQLKQ